VSLSRRTRAPSFLSGVSRERVASAVGVRFVTLVAERVFRARVVRLRHRRCFRITARQADSDDRDGGLKVSVSTVFPRDLSV
jgi:hypothetical protein